MSSAYIFIFLGLVIVGLGNFIWLDQHKEVVNHTINRIYIRNEKGDIIYTSLEDVGNEVTITLKGAK